MAPFYPAGLQLSGQKGVDDDGLDALRELGADFAEPTIGNAVVKATGVAPYNPPTPIRGPF
jgi:hypothetical protein